MRAGKLNRDCLVIGLSWAGATVISLAAWAGLARLGHLAMHSGKWLTEGIGRLYGVLAQLWANLTWLWSVGNDAGWIGPMWWGLATSACMTIVFIGVGIWEHWSRRDDE